MDEFLGKGYKDTLRIFNQEPGNYSYWDQMTKARDRNVGWRIDYFIVSDDLATSVRNAFILPEIHGSDHCPIGLSLTRG